MVEKSKNSVPSPYATFGRLLLYLRRKAGISHQAEFAGLVKSRQQTVSRWEAGVSRPRDTQIPVIARVLNADVEELLRAAGYSSKSSIATFDQPFPVDALSPESFERFCCHLVSRLYQNAKVHLAGASGHTQQGLDIEADLGGNRVHTFQCKRVEEFGRSKVHRAVADHTRKAEKSFLLLSRVASPQAREAIKQHDGWDIWDKEDISLRVRSLPKREQVQLVDTFFRGQRLALLGEMEAGPWQTHEEFFAPFLTSEGAFSHTWQLVGRNTEFEALKSALIDDTVRTVFVSGAGGAGKSRLVREAVEALGHVNAQAVYLSPTEEVTSKSLEDLGGYAKILVVDDAHDRTDLGLLFQFVANPANAITLLLAFRPYGFDYIKAQATSFALSSKCIREVKLSSLSLEDAAKLAGQVLERQGGPVSIAEDIARLTRDCTLATVLGSVIISRDRRQIGLLANEDDFRATLLGRFQDVITGEVGSKGDANAVRKLLNVIALLQPFHPEDSAVAIVFEKVEALPQQELHRLTKLLVEAGVLFRRGGRYRLSPDLLGDQVIERACISQEGSSTGYAERVFEAAGDTYLQNVLVNLGKLDWRRADGDPSNSRLLDGVWGKLKPRSEYSDPHISAVSAVAYYQPAKALDFVEKLIRSGSYRRQLPSIVEHAAYNFSYLHRACECLWYLGKDDQRELGREPSHAIRVLSELCKVAANKPIAYNQVVVDFGISLLSFDSSFDGAYTPLDFLDGILATEGDITTSNGKSISWRRFHVSHSFVGDVRRKVIDAAINLLASKNVRVGVLAARFLRKAVSFGLDCEAEARPVWAVEFVETFSKVEKVLKDNDLDAVVLVELIQSISWHVHYYKNETYVAAKRLLDAVPDTFEFRTAVSLLSAHASVIGEQDFERLGREIAVRFDALADEWRKSYPLAEELRAALANSMQRIRSLAGKDATSPLQFLEHLIQRDLEFSSAVVAHALSDPNSATRELVGVALGKIMRDDRTAGVLAIRQVLKSGSVELVAAAGQAYRMSGISSAEDLANIKMLLSSNDELIVLNAIGIIHGLAQSDPKLAGDLLLSVNLGLSCQVADRALLLFHREEGGVHEYLIEEDIEQILRRIEVLPQLEGHWIETFLSRASLNYSVRTAMFFQRRVEHAALTSDWNIRPCNFGPYGHVKLRFRESVEFGQLLRDMSLWMSDHDASDFLFHERAKQLFGAMFSPFDDALVHFLGEWVRAAGGADMNAICSILDEAPNDFVFQQRVFVDEFLQRASQFGEKSYERATTALYSATTSGLRSGTVGEPFPQDLSMRTNAEKVLQEIPRFSLAYELYDEIRKCAEQRIARSLREAELYEE